MTAAIEDFGPGPLPVIKAICVELGMLDTLNELLTWDESQCNLSPGHRLLALIMNVLTEGQPMYRLPEFFEGTDVENLFGQGVEPDDLNNHACARALDKLADADPSTVLGTVLLRAADAEDLSCDVLHADTTSFSVHGLYETDSDDNTLEITHGYSTDNRRDLRQFKAGLGVNRAGVPLLGEILDGNANDKTWNTELISHLDEWIDTDEPPVYVADSSAFTENTLDEAADHGIDIITRVPRTYSAVDALIDRAWEEDDWTEIGILSETRDEDDAASYKLQSFTETFHDESHTLRCIVVHSSSLDGRTERRIDNELDNTEEDLQNAVGRLTDRSFACEPDAEDALKEWLDDHAHPCFEIDAETFETEEKKSRDGPGRPPKDWDPYKTVYKIAADVQRDAAAIKEKKAKESCFVVATTLDESDEWSDEAVLTEYKDQQTVERRFPVLKDPKRVGPVFLDRPDRVEALGYLLVMALLVYSVIERRARQALEDADEPMELAGGPTSFRPTGRRVLERFENMRVIRIDDDRAIPDNVDVPERVLDLLGLSVEIYGVESE